MRLEKDFFLQPAYELAPKLLGKILVRVIDGKTKKLMITETEAYSGEKDTACHARHGRTERTKVMYEEGGVAYVYLIYGLHNMFNIVCGEKDDPQAVLICGAKGIVGPGRVAKYFQITRENNYEKLYNSESLYLEDNNAKIEYIIKPRVGIPYASKEDRERLWRFCMK